MKPDLITLARTAGFDLSQAEAALLRGLAEKGDFKGLDYRIEVEGPGVAKELDQWLRAWRGSGVDDKPSPETEWWLIEEQRYRDHERLYAEAPFPIISGALLGWVFGSEAVHHLPHICLVNIKVAGDFSVTQCEVDIEIRFTECVFESRCSWSGSIKRLAFTGVHAHYLTISGDYPEEIAFSDVHCHGRRGRCQLKAN